jgi:hypothetical protein
MPSTNQRRIVLAAALTIALAGSVAVYAQQPSTSPSNPAAKGGASQVHSIVLPQYPGEIANGPNVDTYRKDCLLCHSARYVSMQPHLSKTVWQNEVKKMVDAYGAPISEADQALIVDYLVAVKGAASPDTVSASPK